MYVEIKQNSSDYTIRQMTRTLVGGGDHQLSWNFNRASHFLVLAHPAMMDCDLENNVVPWLMENGEELLESRKMDDDDIVWNVVQEREFLAKKNKFILQKAKFKIGTPYRIVVYPCQIEDGNWYIYQVANDANAAEVPVTIPMDVEYKKSLFSKIQTCKFRVRFDANSLEGVLRYKPSCSRYVFPISVESMKMARDGWLYVQLPKGEVLNILVAPEYKKYYNIRITED